MGSPLPPLPESARIRPAPEPNTALRVSSTLAWIVGIVSLFGALLLGDFGFRHPATTAVTATNVVVAILLCMAGYFIRACRRLGLYCLTIAISAILLDRLTTEAPLPAAAGIALIALLVAAANWKLLS